MINLALPIHSEAFGNVYLGVTIAVLSFSDIALRTELRGTTMGTLTKNASDSDRIIYLCAEHTIGRSPRCHLSLAQKSISSHHACIRWNGHAWVVRDLGSRNGTYVNAQRVTERPRSLHRGDTIVFGDKSQTWVLSDDSQPCAMLIGLRDDAERDDAARVIALGDLQAFPNAQDPQMTIFRDAVGRFFLEDANALVELTSKQRIVIGDDTYRLHLPGSPGGTTTTRTSEGRPVESSVKTLRLELRVAPDEETASAAVDAGSIQATLDPRVHLYLLVYLARLRVGQNRLPSVEQDDAGDGWVPCDLLCDDLHVTKEQLCLQVFRIREDFKKLGLSDAGNIVDRRRRGWIRIGITPEQIRIVRM